MRLVVLVACLVACARPLGAFACTRVWRDCEGGHVEGVPRNVRWLPGSCATREVYREAGSEPAEGLPDLDAPPARDARTRVAFARTRTGAAGLLAVDHPFLLAPGSTFEAGGTRFTTSPIVDRTAPEGGAIAEIVRTTSSFLLLFTPVVDESPLFLVLESWHRDAPERRKVAATRAFHAVRDLPPGLPRDRQRVYWSPAEWEVLEPRLPLWVAPQSLEWTDCGSRGLLPLLDHRYDTLVVRARWMDAAGNTGPWSEPRAFAEATR